MSISTCIPLLKDANNILWSLTPNTNGTLQLTSTNRITGFGPPIINDGVNTWALSVDSQGRIVDTSGFSSAVTEYDTYSFPTALPYGISVNSSTGRLTNSDRGFVAANPRPGVIDVTMSAWPPNTPIFCNTCGNATTTTSADLSIWCCTCQSFVFPEDTTMVVFLSE